MLLGKRIKELREEQKLLQRQLAAILEIDTPMFSEIERGDRRAKRGEVITLSLYITSGTFPGVMFFIPYYILCAPFSH